MSNRAAALFTAGAVIVGGTFYAVYRDDIEPYTQRFLSLVSSAAAQPAQMPAPQVPVAEVVTRNVAPSVEFTGHTEATRTVDLRPRVGGAIVSVSVPEGGLVRPGDLLFQIDARPFQSH